MNTTQPTLTSTYRFRMYQALELLVQAMKIPEPNASLRHVTEACDSIKDLIASGFDLGAFTPDDMGALGDTLDGIDNAETRADLVPQIEKARDYFAPNKRLS